MAKSTEKEKQRAKRYYETHPKARQRKIAKRYQKRKARRSSK